ncbi:MAG TPA: nucleotidyltransferase family protein, partial [Elainellaceae cyanobacterium]
MVDPLILKLHGDRPSTTLLAQQLEAQLLTCVRTDIDLLTAETIEFLCDRPLNWPTVLQLAEKNEVSQLLYQNLNDTCPDQVPTGVLQTLQQRQYMHVLKSCYLAQELVHVLHRLTDANIPALAYKGPALASALYGNLALRPFCDLDILIHPDDLVPAKDVLIAEGYDTLAINNRLEAANQWSDSERDFVRQDGRVVVDLHWRLTPRFFAIDLPVDELWERRQSVSLLGTSVPSLAPEDLLLALCIHGAKECWSKLKWVCDIAQLLRCYPQLDWE